MSLTRLDHLLVLTDDIDGTRDFYAEALGLAPGSRPELGFAGHWLYAGEVPCVHVADRDDYAAHSERVGIPSSPRAEGTGPVDHVAFVGDDYEEALARLRRRGVEPKQNLVPGAGVRQLFFADPNGVKIEINVMPG
jgi:catechol 2,3-dioxygenase-like lactoylglutathione lyase family enzyme